MVYFSSKPPPINVQQGFKKDSGTFLKILKNTSAVVSAVNKPNKPSCNSDQF